MNKVLYPQKRFSCKDAIWIAQWKGVDSLEGTMKGGRGRWVVSKAATKLS